MHQRSRRFIPTRSAMRRAASAPMRPPSGGRSAAR